MSGPSFHVEFCAMRANSNTSLVKPMLVLAARVSCDATHLPTSLQKMHNKHVNIHVQRVDCCNREIACSDYQTTKTPWLVKITHDWPNQRPLPHTRAKFHEKCFKPTPFFHLFVSGL